MTFFVQVETGGTDRTKNNFVSSFPRKQKHPVLSGESPSPSNRFIKTLLDRKSVIFAWEFATSQFSRTCDELTNCVAGELTAKGIFCGLADGGRWIVSREPCFSRLWYSYWTFRAFRGGLCGGDETIDWWIRQQDCCSAKVKPLSLSQWLSFKLSGITLLGKIKFQLISGSIGWVSSAVLLFWDVTMPQ